jgi:hypothetical protein
VAFNPSPSQSTNFTNSINNPTASARTLQSCEVFASLAPVIWVLFSLGETGVMDDSDVGYDMGVATTVGIVVVLFPFPLPGDMIATTIAG